jgi:hypothetical protein
MTSCEDILKYITFIEALRVNSSLCWTVPCLNSNDSFDIEWLILEEESIWRYRSSSTGDWIETSSANLPSTLLRNGVDLDNFQALLSDTILSKVSYAYDLIQEAFGLFGEDKVYNIIEHKHDILEQEVARLIKGDHCLSFLRLIKNK